MKNNTLYISILMISVLAQSAVFANSDSIQAKHSLEDNTNQPTEFDEADATFGKRTKIQVPKSGEGKNTGVVYKKQKRTQTVDHRQNDSNKTKTSNRTDHRKSTNTTDHRKSKSTSTTTDHRKSTNTVDHRTNSKDIQNTPNSLLAAPTDVNLYDIKNNRLTISWKDNSNNEFGVSVERGIPEIDRGGINYNWQHVFNVQERIDSNIKGTGWRTDGDDGLASNTKYCYRLRAYHQKQFSGYSDVVCTITK